VSHHAPLIRSVRQVGGDGRHQHVLVDRSANIVEFHDAGIVDQDIERRMIGDDCAVTR